MKFNQRKSHISFQLSQISSQNTNSRVAYNTRAISDHIVAC